MLQVLRIFTGWDSELKAPGFQCETPPRNLKSRLERDKNSDAAGHMA
jgi:hypothetical protein